jgi:hypothetical protein
VPDRDDRVQRIAGTVPFVPEGIAFVVEYHLKHESHQELLRRVRAAVGRHKLDSVVDP